MRAKYIAAGIVVIISMSMVASCWAQTAGGGAGARSGATTVPTQSGQSPGNPSAQTPSGGQAISPGNPVSPGNPLATPSPANQVNPLSSGPTMQQGAQPTQSGTTESLLQQRAPTSSQFNTNPSGILQQQTDRQRLLNESRPNSSGNLSGRDNGRNPALRNDGIATARSDRLAERTQLRESLRGAGINLMDSDDWRFVDYNGRWWFYAPDQSWMYYANDTWTPYEPRWNANRRNARFVPRQNVEFPVGYPTESWRLVNYNGAWWYWTPENSWLVLNDRNNRDWVPFRDRRGEIARNSAVQRQNVGYRGDSNQRVEPPPQADAPSGELDHDVLPTDRTNIPTSQPVQTQVRPEDRP